MLHVEASSYPQLRHHRENKEKIKYFFMFKPAGMHVLYATTNQKHVDVVEEEKEEM